MEMHLFVAMVICLFDIELLDKVPQPVRRKGKGRLEGDGGRLEGEGEAGGGGGGWRGMGKGWRGMGEGWRGRGRLGGEAGGGGKGVKVLA